VTIHREVVLQIGGVVASREPTIIKTVVGSCIAVCFADRVAAVGGMNHFMLPAGSTAAGDAQDRARFGVHAMDLLIGAMQKAGAERKRLVAKVFGGAHVLQLPESAGSVPRRNIRFIEDFLETEGIPIASFDVGGYQPRRVHFHTDTGSAWVKCLGQTGLRRTSLAESQQLRVLQHAPLPVGDVTLFEPGAGR
jgi:chemotaxis protein CheD